jgi:hypothetical protein
MSAATVPVTVKILSGDILSLDVPANSTRRQFYGQVYFDLPEEVAPLEDYQMILLRGPSEEEEEGQGKELPSDDKPLHPQEGEMFCVIMGTDEYRLELQSNWIDVFEATRQDNYLFSMYDFYIYKNDVMIHNECFYHCEDEDRWYLSDGVEENVVGRHSDEISIILPPNAEPFESMDTLARTLVERAPNHVSFANSEHLTITRRVRDYLREDFLRQWRETMEYRHSGGPYQEQEQEQEEQEEQEQEQEDGWAE